MADGLEAERVRLNSVIVSYGDAIAPFDAAMRGYMMRTFEPFFRAGPCLQVGCAHGDQTSLLVDRFDDVTGPEPALEFLSPHPRPGRRPGRLYSRPGGDLQHRSPVRDDNSLHVLEHVANPVAVLAQLGMFLTPSGQIYVVVPNAEAISRKIAVKMNVLSYLEALSEAEHGRRTPAGISSGHAVPGCA